MRCKKYAFFFNGCGDGKVYRELELRRGGSGGDWEEGLVRVIHFFLVVSVGFVGARWSGLPVCACVLCVLCGLC